MKKTLITAVLLVNAMALSAQIRIGVKAGVNFANMEMKTDESSLSISPSSRTSYHFTGLVDIPLSTVFSFQPGVSVTGKGAKYNESQEEGSLFYKSEEVMDLMYLEVPLNAIARFEAGPGKFFIGAGPYVGLGLSGKYKQKVTSNIDGGTETISDESDINFGDGEDELKSLDFGVNGLIGYELSNGLNLNLGYGLGLSNIAGKDSGATSKNKIFSISVGFLF